MKPFLKETHTMKHLSLNQVSLELHIEYFTELRWEHETAYAEKHPIANV